MHDGDQMNGHPLRVLRTQLDLSQKDFAAKVGVSEVTISRAENGHRLSPKVRRQLCERLGITSEELGLLGRKQEVIHPSSTLPPAQEQDHLPFPQTISSLTGPVQPQSPPTILVNDTQPVALAKQSKNASPSIEQQQEQAWLTLGACSLGQLFNGGWSIDEILESLKVVLQGVQGVPVAIQQKLLASNLDVRKNSVSLITGRHVSEEQQAKLHSALGGSIVSSWKLFLSASNAQMLAQGQIQLSLLHQVHTFLHPSTRPYLYAGAYGLIGLALHFQDRNEEALRTYHNAYLSAVATKDPWYVAQSLICQADAYLTLGMYTEALQVIEEALFGLGEIDEEHKRAKAHLLSCWADVSMTIGEYTLAQKKLDEASHYLDDITVIEEFDHICWQQLAGKRAVMAGDYQQAIDHLERALAANPPHWRVRHAGILTPLAIAYARNKEWEKSLSVAQQAIPIIATLKAPMTNKYFLNYIQDDILKSFPCDSKIHNFLTEIQQQLPHLLAAIDTTYMITGT